jgi:DNA invertase Pin-like site-specific DNA recombinase
VAKTTPAFAYLRVSGKGQVEGDGFERQLGAIRAYASAYGIRIVQVFEEKGVSGKTDLAREPTRPHGDAGGLGC